MHKAIKQPGGTAIRWHLCLRAWTAIPSACLLRRPGPASDPLSQNCIHCASGWALLGHSSGRSLAFSGGGCGNASQPESGGRGIPSNIVMYKDANGGAGTANSAVNGCGRAAAQVRMFDAGLSIFFVREQHRERGVPERLRHSKIRHWRASPSDCC